jgi:hypothetical protein
VEWNLESPSRVIHLFVSKGDCCSPELVGGGIGFLHPFRWPPCGHTHTHTCAQGSTVTACALAGKSHQGALEKQILLFFCANKPDHPLSLSLSLSLALALCGDSCRFNCVVTHTWWPHGFDFLPPRAERIPNHNVARMVFWL